GAGTTLGGDPKTLSRRFEEYLDLGIDTFVLSGYPGRKKRTMWQSCCFRNCQFGDQPGSRKRSPQAER
ncbi:MAG: hypothetical protein WA217_20045, partial [Candidatus Binatus sp.]